MLKVVKRLITIKHQFVGFHRWPYAPDSEAFLRSFHRHVFKVELTLEVDHDNRDIEFFAAQKDLVVCCKPFEGKEFTLSCEMIAHQIAEAYTVMGNKAPFACQVSEDGENAALLYFDKE